MTDHPHSVSGTLRTALGHGPFARYLLGEALSMTGTWMQVMAQSWVMTSLTASAVMFGLVNFAAGVPMLALSLLGGTFADRYDRRRILLITQVVQIALALLLGGLVAREQIQIWHLTGVAFVLGISNSFEMPAATALVPELVPRPLLAAAIAIERAVFHGTRLVGPAMAGYVIGLWGAASAFYINALSFLAFIVALLTLRRRGPGSAEEEAQRHSGIRQGIAYVRSDQPTLAMIAIMALTTFFVFPVMVVMLPLYARNVLLLGSDRMGLLMGIASLGSVTGSVGLLAVPRALRGRVMFAAVLAGGAALGVLSRADRFAMAAVSIVVLSLGVSSLIGLANIIVQERAPGPLRGRVSAVAGLSFFGLVPLASLALTGVADALGLRTTFLYAGLLYLAATLAVLARSRRRLFEPPNA